MTHRYPKFFFCFIFVLKISYPKSKHMGLSFKSHLKHLILNGCRLAYWYRVGSVTNSERMFWLEYGQIIIFFIFYDFFLLFTWKVLCSLFSIECFIYIDFVPYVHFKTKHNLHLHEHPLTAWLIDLHLSCISCYFF